MPQNLTGLCAEPISVLLRSTPSIAVTTTASGSTSPTLQTPDVSVMGSMENTIQKDVVANTTQKATPTIMGRDAVANITDLVMAGTVKKTKPDLANTGSPADREASSAISSRH